MERIPVVGPAYIDSSLPANAQSNINLFWKSGGPGGREYLQKIPGLESHLTAGTGAVEAAFEYRGVVYVVSGNNFYSLGASSATLIGSVSGSQTIPDIAGNADNQIMIARGSASYIYNTSTSTLTQITDSDFPSECVSCAYVKGVFAYTRGEDSFGCSNTGNGLAHTGTDFDYVSGGDSDIVSLIEDHDELVIFCQKTTEFWTYAANGSAFPFQERLGAKLEIGLAAKNSVGKIDNSVVWLARSRLGENFFVRLSGYQPINITPPALADRLSTFSTVSDARAFTYQQGGHEFYCVTFQTDNETWCFDPSIPDPHAAWHKRSTFGVGRWRANCHAYLNGTHYIGDYLTGAIYKMKTDCYTDAGGTISCERVFSHLPGGHYSRLVIEFEEGVGLSTGQGSDPQAMLTMSDNGAKTYGTELWRSIGAMGDYGRIVEWNRLGSTEKTKTFKVVITDPVNVRILGGSLAVD